ncbi:Threonylcarbamoyl-AMP synthase [Pseudomonas savastanoi]|uniref:Threonylcarbamoyl-AMP synthase n=3 Tax=Pseudomonas syringae group genomosp. 2 TaxID=251698 RepID=A0A3M5FYQ0_PSESS|nr:Threonylcarbamoyl-AMP synthase [Pseudomonas savastanoi]
MVSSWRVQQAAQDIRAGAVIAYPTEAVWGLGCDPWDEEAVYRLLAIKSRPVEKGLILIADNIRQFDFLFEDFPQLWLDRMASTWPGPNTWLVPHQNLLPEWITGIHETVALRVTDHPTVRELCALVGPLISTSANPAGRPAARSRLRVEQYFRGQIDGVLGGSLGAEPLNKLLPEALSQLPQDIQPEVFHQSGKNHDAVTAERYRNVGVARRLRHSYRTWPKPMAGPIWWSAAQAH